MSVDLDFYTLDSNKQKSYVKISFTGLSFCNVELFSGESGLNFTYNYFPLEMKIGLDFHEITKGKPLGKYIEYLREAYNNLIKLGPNAAFPLIKGNGAWGNYEDFRQKLEILCEMAEKYPDYYLEGCF